MDVSTNLSGTLFTAALSSLGTANKQPQLALTLIEKSLSGLQTVGAAQSPSSTVPLAATPKISTKDIGTIIDIRA